jgi:serine/threonine protein kinase
VPDVMKTVGRYEILREVGRGGMAMVYLARQTDLDRFVALKELGAFHASDPSFAQRFLRESRVAGSLSHPNIVTVHDYFEHDGTPYIAMEYVERGSLRPHIGRMTLAQAGGVLEGLLAGLANAEQHGIVHRDLKPENLMVTADGRVKIADFGIAKATTKMQTGAFLTATGTTVGTPTYMAPEQAMAQDIGPWTDLYSVGCMAFEMFTGRVPFHDSDAPMAILLRHVNEPIPSVKSIDPSVDEGVSEWIEQLLVKDPKQRTQSANEAWDEFEEIVIGLLGPRWRRKARLLEPAEHVDTPKPLTPAPFQGTSAADTPTSDEFQSFAWGKSAGPETGEGAPPPGPYTPPPSQTAPVPPEPQVGPPTPPPSPATPAPAPAPAAATDGGAATDAPEQDSGFVTFGAPAPSPPSDALLPPAAAAAAGAAAAAAAGAAASEASAAAPPAETATPAPTDAAPAAPADAAAVTPPPSEAVPAADDTGTGAAGFETYVAPPPLRPPTEEPPQDAPALPQEPPAATPPAATPPVATPPPTPAATSPPTPPAAPTPTPPSTPAAPPPARTPEPVAATPAGAGGAATVMPEALRERPAERPPVKEEEREGRRLFPIVLVAGAVLAAVVGFLVGGSGGGESTGGAPSVPASNAAMQVSVPAGWTRLPTAPTVPGLTLEDPVAFAADGNTRGEAVVFGMVTEEANNSTLLPNPLLQAAGEVPSGREAVNLGPSDLQAYRYRNLQLEGLERGLTIFAAPTTEGVATVACLAGAGGAPSCDAIANTLELTSGEGFAVGPNPDYAESVSGAMAELNQAATRGNRALRAADTPAAQARAAGSLQNAYQGASGTLDDLELSPADQGANARLVTALGGVADAYGRAEAAARNNSRAGFRRANTAVEQAQQDVADALQGLRAAGYEIES